MKVYRPTQSLATLGGLLQTKHPDSLRNLFLAFSAFLIHNKYHMKIVIIGAGNLGIQIAHELITENRDVVVIERNPVIVRGIANELDCLVIEGNGENLDILEEADISSADWFIALTGSDEANIVACGLVSETYPSIKTIARIRGHYFSSFHTKKTRILGVDYILNPEAETAEAIARLIFRGMSPEIIDVKEAGIQLRKIKGRDDDRLPGKTLQEIRQQVGRDFIIPAIARDNDIIVPSGDFIIQESDFVYILGEPHQLDKLFGKPEKIVTKLKSIIIIGAGGLVKHLLAELGASSQSQKSLFSKMRNPEKDQFSTLSLIGNPSIKVIDEDFEKVKEISQEYTSINSICRTFADELLFSEESIDKADLVLCMSESHSTNLLTAIMAKHYGARKVLSVVFNDLYLQLLGVVPIDAIISQKNVATSAVLDIVRKAHIRRLYSFAEHKIELVEVALGGNFPSAGITIKELNLPRGILAAFIIHKGETIIPAGDTHVEKNDSIGIVLPKDQINRLEAIFG